MDSENRLRRELAELNLLLRDLARIPAFPADLLELISGKVESISHLALPSESQLLSNKVEELFEALSDSEPEYSETDSEAFADFTLTQVMPDLTEIVSSIRINDRLGQRRLIDLTKSMTLNDRFRFQREFFENNPQKMHEVFSVIDKTQSTEEALVYLRNCCTVDEESDCFQDFCMMLNLHFASISDGSQSN